jgi:transposase InsO family protein
MAINAFKPRPWELGLPRTIPSDNGVPFSSPHAIHGLSKSSVHLLRLRIAVERIKPGNPQLNGRHERMHTTLKQYCARLAGMNMLQQKELFERFIDKYNNERPNKALEMKRPADLY